MLYNNRNKPRRMNSVHHRGHDPKNIDYSANKMSLLTLPGKPAEERASVKFVRVKYDSPKGDSLDYSNPNLVNIIFNRKIDR